MYEPARRTAGGLAEARGRSPRIFGSADAEADPLHLLRHGEQQHGDLRLPRPIPIAATSSPRPSSIRPCWRSARTCERSGYDVTLPGGRRPAETSTSASSSAPGRPDTLLVTIMHANNETRRDLPHRAALADRQGDRSGDRLPYRRHAIGGQDPHRPGAGAIRTSTCSPSPATSCTPPRGSACSTSSRGTPCRPLLIGGHQEEGRRAGTENVPYIVGPGQGPGVGAEAAFEDEKTRVRRLRDRLERALRRAASRTSRSTASRPPGCPTRSTSPATTSRARGCSTN